MKRIINKYWFFAILILLQFSCSKKWIEPQPLSFFTASNVYVDKAGFNSLLITMRKNLVNECTGNRHFLSTEFVYSDLAVALFQMDSYKNTPNASQYFPLLTMFDKMYSYIKDANTVISRIDDITWSSENEKNAFLAEAYWHRAYWYYRLVHSYGDVPWIGGESKEAKLDFQTYSRWPILDKIQSDLEYSVKWLPASAEPGAISKGAGYHLLTKVYLANTKFDEAITAANQLINGRYQLMTKRFGSFVNDGSRNVIWDIHRPENMNLPTNTETILSIVDRLSAPQGARTAGLFTMRLFTPSWWKIRDATGGIGTVSTLREGDTLGNGNGDVRTNSFYYYGIWADKNYDWKSTPDLRRSDINWIEMNEVKYNIPTSPNFGQVVNLKYYSNLNDTVDTWYPWPIYLTYVPNAPGALTNGGNGDWSIFRLAETYLLRAEAYYWKGQTDLAANDINEVRKRANAPLITAADVTIDYIFDERARELYMEEPRHAELVRVSYIMAKLNLNGYSLANFSTKNYYYDREIKYNKFYSAPALSAYGNTARLAPFHVLWAIPQSVILANTLAQINQNTGYDGADKNIAPITTPIQ